MSEQSTEQRIAELEGTVNWLLQAHMDMAAYIAKQPSGQSVIDKLGRWVGAVQSRMIGEPLTGLVLVAEPQPSTGTPLHGGSPADPSDFDIDDSVNVPGRAVLKQRVSMERLISERQQEMLRAPMRVATRTATEIQLRTIESGPVKGVSKGRVLGYDEKRKTVTALMSAATANRHGEIVLPSAYTNIPQFLSSNSAYLWNHLSGSEDPQHRLGNVIDAWTQDSDRPESDGLYAVCQYAYDLNPLARFVFDMEVGGFMPAFSIGFWFQEYVCAWDMGKEGFDEAMAALPEYARTALLNGEVFAVHTAIELGEISKVQIGSSREAVSAIEEMLRAGAVTRGELARLGIGPQRRTYYDGNGKPRKHKMPTADPTAQDLVQVAALVRGVQGALGDDARELVHQKQRVIDAAMGLIMLEGAQMHRMDPTATPREHAMVLAQMPHTRAGQLAQFVREQKAQMEAHA